MSAPLLDEQHQRMTDRTSRQIANLGHLDRWPKFVELVQYSKGVLYASALSDGINQPAEPHHAEDAAPYRFAD